MKENAELKTKIATKHRYRIYIGPDESEEINILKV